MDENEELDDEWKPTPIKIPKVTAGAVQLLVNITDIQENKATGWCTYTLKKQVVAGFTIPQGTTISVKDLNPHRPSGMIMVGRDTINNLLKTLYLDSLRTIKKK